MPAPTPLPPIEADIDGRLCLITGASSGIGAAAALGLARLGARVVIACRSQARGLEARRAILDVTPRGRIDVLPVDVADPVSVDAFAQAFRARHERLDVLVNNAGVWAARRRLGPDGHELTWGTNMLGYVRVVEALVEPLARARGRVINVASRLAHSLDLDDVDFVTRSYHGMNAYAQSKQSNRMWTWALARRLESSGIAVHAMHPRGVRTPLFRKGGGALGLLGALWARLYGRTPAEGADTIVWLAATEASARGTGRFWVDRSERECEFRDPVAEDTLFELCHDMARERAA